MEKLKAVFGLFLVVALFYLAWKIIPPYMNDYEFQDSVAQIAKEATFSHDHTEDQIREKVAKKASELNIPMTADQVHIGYNGPEVIITGDYSIHVDIPVKPMDLSFHVNSKKI